LKKAIDKVISTIVIASDVFAITSLVICTLTAFVNTVMRYIFKMPINFSEELCVLTLIFLVFSSLLRLERDNEHLNMTVLYNVFPEKVQDVVNVVRSIVTIVLSVCLSYAGFVVVNMNFINNTRSQVLDWPYGVVYLIIPVTFALIALIRLANVRIRNCGDNTEAVDGGSERC